MSESPNNQIGNHTEKQVNESLKSQQEADDLYRLHRRFDRMGRLVGDSGMKTLFSSHVMVIGLGGVGSWAAEMLVRSGVGRITLVDFDDICVTNFNRQIHSMQGFVGQKKVDVMKDRLLKINPQLKVVVIDDPYSKETSEKILGLKYTAAKAESAASSDLSASAGILGKVKALPENVPDAVIDAIDHITGKCHLLATCKEFNIPIISCTGSGGRMDPTKIKVADMAETMLDPLARDVRRILREKYAFPEKGAFGVYAVYSDEQVIMPKELHYDGGKGFRCVCPQGDNEFFSCDDRNLIMGSAGFVTAAFGMAASAWVVRSLTGNSN